VGIVFIVFRRRYLFGRKIFVEKMIPPIPPNILPHLSERNVIRITFAKINFNCPHCGKLFYDDNDVYVNRCNKNKDFCTSIKCSCEKRFKMTYDITGQAVGFLTTKKLK